MTDPSSIRLRLDATPAALVAAARGAPAAAPAAGEWTPTDIVRHLIVVEREVWHVRLAQLASEDHPRWEWAEPDRWLGEPGASLERLLDTFAADRAMTVLSVDALGPDSWTRRGTHATFGELDLGGLLGVLVDHDAEHLASFDVQADAPL